jgi:hypothetical protein
VKVRATEITGNNVPGYQENPRYYLRDTADMLPLKGDKYIGEQEKR